MKLSTGLLIARMKTIGLIGGMSWQSSASYYRLLNQGIEKRLGGFHSAKIIMYSVEFAEIHRLQHQGNWQQAGEILASAAKTLEQGGADFILLCTNTMHKVAHQITDNIGIPLLHIADATASSLLSAGHSKVGLLGTSFTMEQEFYKQKLLAEFNLEVIVPGKDDRETVNQIIFSELVAGKISDASRHRYLEIIDKLVVAGAEAVILGCTEIGMLAKQSDTNIPLSDTTKMHVEAALNEALK